MLDFLSDLGAMLSGGPGEDTPAWYKWLWGLILLTCLLGSFAIIVWLL
ncbi:MULTISPECIES: hypothetical protein [unclassified Sphingomonas]|nr:MULTISPECIES: hypothetical protein [unclassified Sphingomonas]